MASTYLEPLRHRDFALLWSGQTVSMLGDGVFTVTLALETLRVDHHPIGLSYVLAARLVPAVVFVLVGSDLARGVAVAVIAALVATGAVHLPALVVMAFVFGLADALFFPASTAITPELLPAELLVGGSALTGISTQLAQILIGPAVGGLIAGLVGTAWGFGIDAASFAVSAACLAAMRARPKPSPSGGSPLHDVLDGLRYCRSQRWLWVSILGAALGNFAAFSPLGVLVPLLVERSLHGGGIALGLVLGAGGLGGIAASLLLGNRGAPRRMVLHLWLGWGLSGIGVIGLGVVPDLWLAGGVAFVVYGLDAYGTVLWNPLMQRSVPAAMLGRVSAVDYFFGFALSPLGLVAAGAAAEVVGVRATLMIGGAVTGLTTLIPLLPGVGEPELPR
jgi:MFS family permease